MRRTAGLAASLAGLAAALAAAFVIAPLGPTTIDPDASASVLYFERLVAGRRLEAFVPTTPKPLLTVVDGLAWQLTSDWRVLTWIALACFGLAVALAALFVWRAWAGADRGRAAVPRASARVGTAAEVGAPGEVGAEVEVGVAAAVGAAAGAVFIAVALASWSDLALEVSRANSLVPSLACWAAAGVALSGPRRRPGIAGIALLLGGLARFETIGIVVAILGVAALLRVAEAIAGRRLLGDGPRCARRDVVLIVGLGLLAIPVACLHDWLLTGDPLYWTAVPARYTAIYAPGLAPTPLVAYLGTLAGRLAGQWPLVALAGVGALALAARRAYVPLVGLGSLAVGMIVLLCGLAVRGIYISNRYDEPLDLALLGLAGFAVAALVELAAGRLLDLARPDRLLAPLGRLGAMAGLAATLVVTVAAAGGIMGSPAAWDPTVAATLAPIRSASVDLDANLARLAALVPATPLASTASRPAGAPPADPHAIELFVPSTLRSRLAVAAGLPLTVVGDTFAAYMARPSWAGLHPGQWLYHDPAVDRPTALTRALDADSPDLGGLAARTLWFDATSGVRLLRVVAAR
ncbi:MAG TPA: hypothetical protein VF802_00385 [Candidatus Limnocylindrales bacterium]